MNLRCIWLLLICVFMLAPGGAQGAAVEPVGEVVTAPVVTWSYGSGEGTSGTAALMVPAKMDDAGTLTLVLRGNAATTLVRLDRSHVPDKLHFIFGDAESLYVHVPRRLGWSPDQVETMYAEIPYDKSAMPRRTRTVKLTDAVGRPLEGFSLNVNFAEGINGERSNVKIPLKIAADGMVKLPLPVAVVNYAKAIFMAQHRHNLPPPTELYLQLTDDVTMQSYDVPLRETKRPGAVTVMLPVVRGDDVPEGVDVVEGEVVGPDGARTGAVSLGFGTGTHFMTGMDRDPTTITVKTLRPGPDGTFRIAVSDEFRGRYDAGDGLRVQVYEDEFHRGLFRSSSHLLNRGAGVRIELSKRLSLVASLVGDDGEPVVLSDRLQEGVYPNFLVARIDDEGKQLDRDSISVNVKETTGALFDLKNLPVPGRYSITAFDQTYGPVDVAETSPTAPLEFRVMAADGKHKGVVKDEAGNTLAGALVMLLEEVPRTGDYHGVTSMTARLEGMDKEQGLELLNGITSKTLDYTITGDDGTYSFPRTKARGGRRVPAVYAVAPGRLGGYSYVDNNQQILPHVDVILADAQLPAKARATGVVYAPEMVPDNDQLGQLKPLPDGDHKYRIYVWSSREWFGYARRGAIDDWQYITDSPEFTFGQPFEYDVPAGTSYTLAARPADSEIHLNMHLWKQGPVKAGETVELEPVTLRALQPFTLKVTYADGSPAKGLRINALYGTQPSRTNGEIREPVTDENGEYLLYGDEGLAPQITVMRYMPIHTSEVFRIQPLDMSTSVPTLTLQLDPKIWGREGQGRQ